MSRRHRSGMLCLDWNDERVERLKALAAKLVPASRIAAEFGVTRNTICGKLHRLGITQKSRDTPKPPKPPKPRRQYQTFARKQYQPKPVRQFVLPGNRRAAHPTMPPSLPEKPAEPVPATRVTLMGLTADTCRWPLFSDADPNGFYCGGAPVEGLPYCRAHCRKAYTAPRERA